MSAKGIIPKDAAKDLFQSMLKANESLFLDAVALDFDYLPKLLLHRENQQKHIASSIAPLLQDRNGKNLLITGPPGIGKTAAARWVLRELEDKYSNEDIQTIYINCWKMNTAFKLLVEMCRQVDYKFVQNKRTDELLDVLTTLLNERKATVFVFDEVDKLEDFSVLYAILEDINRKVILLITNEKEWIVSLDRRIYSRLTAELLEFLKYNYEETIDILKQRADFAFAKNCWDPGAFKLIAEKTAELGDLRAGLSLLKEAGELAETGSSRKISLAHASIAIKKFDTIRIRKYTDFEESDKSLLEFIKSSPNKSMSELFDIYNAGLEKNNSKISYRTFQRWIKRLRDNKMISVAEQSTDKGKIFVVNLAGFGAEQRSQT